MKYKIWWLIALGVILMGAGMLGSLSAINAGKDTAAPGMDLVNVTAGSAAVSSGSTLTPDDAAAVQTAVKGSKIAWWAMGHGTIGTDTRSTQADVFAVSGTFQDFHHMDMMFGSFLPRKDEGSTAVVLDSDLAYRLFGTYNAVGLDVQYQGMTFQVCGVVRADDSLLGLMSGDGQFRAYVSGYGLVSTKKLTIAGLEAQVPSGAPGEAVSTIQTAMQQQSIPTGSFLFEDMTEKVKLASETAALPAALLSVAALLVLLAFIVRVFRGIWRESAVDLHEDYFRNVAARLGWRLVRLLALIAASAGLVWLIWSLSGLKFYLPTRFIPGSWIDTKFYTGLIKSESQTALTAAAYPRYWWYSAWVASTSVAGMMEGLAYAGTIVTALSLRSLFADRKAAALVPSAKRAGAWDIPSLWILALLSYGVYALAAHLSGLPFYSGLRTLYALALGLAVFDSAMHKEKLEKLFFRKIEKEAEIAEETPAKGRRL